MTIPNVDTFDGQKPSPEQPQPEFNQNMSDELDYFNALPEQLNPAINEMNTTAMQVTNDAASAEQSASDAFAAAGNNNYKGEWISGTSSALEAGETWQVNGAYYVSLKATSAEPVNDNVNWREVVTSESITTAQNDIVGGSIFKGSNGESVGVGDEIPVGKTHIRISIGGDNVLVRAWDDITYPATILSIPTSENGFRGYDIVTDQGTVEFLTDSIYMLRGRNNFPTMSRETYIEAWGCVGDWDYQTKNGTDNLPNLQKLKAYIDSLDLPSTNIASGEQESAGVCAKAGSGTFGLSSAMEWGTTPVKLAFDGTFQTVFAPLSGFVGNTLFRLGSKTTQELTYCQQMEGCSFNCAAITGVSGYEFYGLRDASYIRDILVTAFTSTATFSNFAGESGGAFMSQGVEISNVHAISFVHEGGDIHDINGLFETKITAGKALLNSDTTDITNDIIGYRLGRIGRCRGVHIHACAAGNFFGTGFNAGIVYDDAVRCWDTECTFEGINGPNVKFGLTSTASVCHSENGRHYNPAPASAPNNYPYEFGNSNTCTARMGSGSASGLIASFSASAINSHITIDMVSGSIEDIKANAIIFNGAPGAGCSAKGYSSVDAAYWGLTDEDLSREIGANGTQMVHDQFWSTLDLGTQNQYRIRDNTGNVMMTVDGDTGTVTIDTANIKMENLSENIGTTGFISKGEIDSAGTGFRVIKIPN